MSKCDIDLCVIHIPYTHSLKVVYTVFLVHLCFHGNLSHKATSAIFHHVGT
jgi:hypothetical protein